MEKIFRDRYSCRSYSNRPLEREKIVEILEAARIAPSACNRQPWTFLVVNDETGRKVVCESYDREWIKDAPVYIIAFGHHDDAWHRPYDNKDHTDVDVSIAVEHICLQATSLGIASCWVCNFNPEIIKSHFNVGEGVEPIAIIPLGYAADGAKVPQKVRKAFDDVVKWNKL